jgi:formamidopyrimidine-DNA glycosylase
MPELPEVEVTRQSLIPYITDTKITSVFLGKPLRWPLGVSPHFLVGKTIKRIERRGKYLLFVLDEGLLILHLGMSGSLSFVNQPPFRDKHDHFELSTDTGTLRLNDPRRFGAVVYAPSLAAEMAKKLLGNLGVEPFSKAFTSTLLYRGCKQSNTTIKQLLLAGRLVVGVGNIYVAESLFRAGIRPNIAAKRMTKSHATSLYHAILKVLQTALQHGGSTLRNFSNAQGKNGYFQLQVMVYGRQGKPCYRCGTTIKQDRKYQRSSFYCPQCQR